MDYLIHNMKDDFIVKASILPFPRNGFTFKKKFVDGFEYDLFSIYCVKINHRVFRHAQISCGPAYELKPISDNVTRVNDAPNLLQIVTYNGAVRDGGGAYSNTLFQYLEFFSNNNKKPGDTSDYVYTVFKTTVETKSGKTIEASMSIGQSPTSTTIKVEYTFCVEGQSQRSFLFELVQSNLSSTQARIDKLLL